MFMLQPERDCNLNAALNKWKLHLSVGLNPAKLKRAVSMQTIHSAFIHLH